MSCLKFYYYETGVVLLLEKRQNLKGLIRNYEKKVMKIFLFLQEWVKISRNKAVILQEKAVTSW